MLVASEFSRGAGEFLAEVFRCAQKPGFFLLGGRESDTVAPSVAMAVTREQFAAHSNTVTGRFLTAAGFESGLAKRVCSKLERTVVSPRLIVAPLRFYDSRQAVAPELFGRSSPERIIALSGASIRCDI